MQNYKPGTAVPLTFSLIDESGNFLTPVSITWRILDEAEVVLQTWTSVANPTTSDLVVTIPLGLTGLTAPALRAIRTVEVEVITAQGTVYLSDAIMLQGATALAFGINSFQTYAQAILAGENFAPSSMPGWAVAERESREKALIESYQRLLRLPIRSYFGEIQSIDSEFSGRFSLPRLSDMTPAQMLTLYAPLMASLRRAQVIEADEVLVADPIIAARKNGLTGMTVGESTQFFRAGQPLDLPVGARAMKEMSRWVNFTARIGRS